MSSLYPTSLQPITLSQPLCPIKRFMDIGCSLISLPLLLLPLTLMGVILAIHLRRFPLFFQKRSGLRGAVFTIVKLRTFRTSCPSSSTSFTRVLRKLRIDELPQLWNILWGQMSLVGPRPHSLEDDARFTLLHPNYMMRYAVKPGAMGLAQVHGYVGEINTDADLQNRLEKDFEYIGGRTLLGDLKIIWNTLF